MPDQQDDDALGRPGARREVGERFLDAVTRGPRVGEVGDVGLGDGVLLLRGVDEAGRPLLELLRVLLVARDAGDDEQVRLLSEGGRRTQHAAHERTHD
jgi:hypothetical protein